MKSMDKFLALKEAEQQRVNFEMTYVDVAGGDLVAGLLLSQIIYWFLPNKEGKVKTRVTYKGRRALAKNRGAWYGEIRVTPRQYDRAIAILIKLNIVDVVNSMFGKNKTPFIMLNEDVFLSLYEQAISRFHQTVKPVSPNGNTGFDESVKPSTETTAKTINNENEKGQNLEPCSDYAEKLARHVIGHYLNQYKTAIGKDHPVLRRGQWERVAEEIAAFDGEYSPDWGAMIDRHFERCMDTDYNINHFATAGVLTNILYEGFRA